MVVPMSVSWHSLKLPYFFSPAFTASMQPGFGWQEEMNTRLSSMSSRSTRRSVMYLPTQMGRLPRYFLTTFSSPSITSSAGLMPSRFAPKASTPEQRPLLAIKSSRSSTKLSSTRLARLCSRIVMLRGAGHLQPTWPLSAPDSPARYRYSGCPPHRHSRIRLPPASHSGSRTKACC